MKPQLAACIALALLTTAPLEAREFRKIEKLGPAPKTATANADNFIPVKKSLVDEAIEAIMSAWSTPRMQASLSKDFYERDRLKDVIDSRLPRDAEVRIMGIGGTQTLQQREEVDPAGVTVRISEVSVTVRTQLEYTDPANGLMRFPGTTEYRLNFREKLDGGSR